MPSEESIRLAQKVYLACLGRPADPDSLDYWAIQFDQHDDDVTQLLYDFSKSEEFKATYNTFTNQEIITQLFKQMFGREVDEPGLRYYCDQLSAANLSLSEIAVQIAIGAAGSDDIALKKKIDLAVLFCDEVIVDNKMFSSEYIAATKNFFLQTSDTTDIDSLAGELKTLVATFPKRANAVFRRLPTQTNQQNVITPKKVKNSLIDKARRLLSRASKKTPAKREVIFHIGADKTGSTALQVHLFQNRERLEERGLFVPKKFLGVDNGHAHLFLHFNEANLKTVADEINQSSCSKALISWEGIHFIGTEDIALLGRHFKDFDIRIIYYVRNQTEILQSGIMQELKTDRLDFDFFDESRVIDKPDNRNYYATIKNWQKVFRNANITIVPYLRDQLFQQNIVADILSRVGDFTDYDFDQSSSTVNESLDYYTCVALNLIDSMQTMNKYERKDLVEVLLDYKRDKTAEKYFFTKSEVDAVAEHYKESNTKLLSEYEVCGEVFSSDKKVWKDSPKKDAVLIKKLADILSYVEQHRHISILKDGEAHELSLSPHLKEGWHRNETWGTWSTEQRSTIELLINPENIDESYAKAVIAFRGMYAKTVSPKTLVLCNTRSLGYIDLSKAKIEIPMTEIIGAERICIELKHPQAVVLDTLDINKDTREMAYGIHSLDLRMYKGS